MRLDRLVLIGQFAPLHNGHIALLHRALERADRVVVLTGSAGRARNSRHPWTAAERERMIRAALPARTSGCVGYIQHQLMHVSKKNGKTSSS
jgi:bifunctional NMN adenylyltransferase/nudix hydrolase